MNQTLQGYAGTIGALSMIAIWLPALLNGPLSLMLAGFTLLFAVLFIVGSVRRRRSAVGSVAILLLVGVGTWGLLFGIGWYFQHIPPLSFTP